MTDVKANGREFTISFDRAQQGFRMTVWEWLDDDYEVIDGYNNTLCLMMTKFEALCHLSLQLFDENITAEEFAVQLDVPVQFFDDELEDA